MLFGQYRFKCSFETEALLPPYKGSTFRGVFGHSLKSAVCASKQQDCSQCLLKHQCLYPAVFETSSVRKPPDASKIRDFPHPFVIEPPATTNTHFAKGSPLEFSLLLFGDLNNSLPYFIFAFERMGRRGIGRRINGTRGRFVLNEVILEGETIYDRRTGFLEMNISPRPLPLPVAVADTKDPARLTITLETPLRFKSGNHLSDVLPFQELIRLMMRRAAALCACYGDGEPEWDYRGMLERAKKVKTLRTEVSWNDWQRYSMRQKQRMEMGGLLGSVVYEGGIGGFMPLIEFCALVHIGKQTTFGLGKVGVSGGSSLRATI